MEKVQVSKDNKSEPKSFKELLFNFLSQDQVKLEGIKEFTLEFDDKYGKRKLSIR